MLTETPKKKNITNIKQNTFIRKILKLDSLVARPWICHLLLAAKRIYFGKKI